MLLVPEPALACGFANEPIGTHISRTIMVAELRLLLGACPPEVGLEEYRAAAVEANVLLKRTVSTRRSSFRALRELYGLAPELRLFRGLRDLWDGDREAQPLLALLCAAARDPLLRASAAAVLSSPEGAAVTPAMLAASVAETFPGRYHPSVLTVAGRELASSWQQSGHLVGHGHCRTGKRRSATPCRPLAVAYALLLGHLCGVRGDGLFRTLWAGLLDLPASLLREQAIVAARHGWLEYRHAGSVTEVGFRHLLRN